MSNHKAVHLRRFTGWTMDPKDSIIIRLTRNDVVTQPGPQLKLPSSGNKSIYAISVRPGADYFEK